MIGWHKTILISDWLTAGSWRTDSTGERFVKTNNGLIYEGHKVAVEEVGR